MANKEAPRWRKVVASVAFATIAGVAGANASNYAEQAIAQAQGPFDPEDARRHQRPRSDLHPYTTTDEQRREDIKGGVAGIVLVGGFIGIVYALRRIRD